MRATMAGIILVWSLGVGLGLFSAAPAADAALAAFWQEKVEASVLNGAKSGPVECLILLSAQADLSGATQIPDKLAKGRYVYETLTAAALSSQAEIVAILRADGVEHRPFWIVNAIWVRAGPQTIERLARHRQVRRIVDNARILMDQPRPGDPDPGATKSPAGIEWNILTVRGPEAWAEGNEGQAAVIGGIDTGYDWQHPALINQYRGWDGMSADHNYNWHDSIHSGGGDCGPDAVEPCDDGYHGTHTMGIMVGDDGDTNQIGLAPSARWIGCRCMDEGFGTPATYIECLQWMIAPTDLDDLNPDPARAPDAINNSWICTASEGCVDPNTLKAAVEAVRAAGIVVVASAGNSGPACSSVAFPPAIYNASFSVGATNDSDLIANFSSRGPVTVDGSDRLKPDVSAPGQGVRSCAPGGVYVSASGTSMAGPHVAGLVALVVTANENYRGKVDQIEMIIKGTAVPKSGTLDCGEFPGLLVPNAVYGYGRIDAYEAHYLALTHIVGVPDPATDGAVPPAPILGLSNTPNPFNPRTVIEYELRTAATVSLTIFDLTGRRVRRLLAGREQSSGQHTVTWDGRADNGRDLASGTYLCRVRAGSQSLSHRMSLIR
jgi:serine protease AprX